MNFTLTQEQREAQTLARRFTEREVIPYASQYELRDEYPESIVNKMAELGFFGIIVPEKYEGLGMDYICYALVVEEIARGWMSLAGVINSHLMLCYMLMYFGTEEQREKYLAELARGQLRGAFALTEPESGSDAASLQTGAIRDGDYYILNGNKMFITNSERGNTFAVFCKTDKTIRPQHKGISVLLVDRDTSGFTIGRSIKKLGYRGLKTCELTFQDCRIPKENLLGSTEGQGFKQLSSALEVGRINVAARGVGLARAAFEDSIKYAQQRKQFGQYISEFQAIQFKLTDMATHIEAGRLLTLRAADMKNRGERCDLEAGMAKLFSSEASVQAASEGIQIHGGYGYTEEFAVERYFRDCKLLTVGEGTSEIQRLIIARRLLEKYRI